MSVVLRAGRKRERWNLRCIRRDPGYLVPHGIPRMRLVGDTWHRICLAASVLVPISAARFFQVFLGEGSRVP